MYSVTKSERIFHSSSVPPHALVLQSNWSKFHFVLLRWILWTLFISYAFNWIGLSHFSRITFLLQEINKNENKVGEWAKKDDTDGFALRKWCKLETRFFCVCSTYIVTRREFCQISHKSVWTLQLIYIFIQLLFNDM